ncbi:MAG: ribokinase [Thermomicrobiales bacterium]
MAARVLVIGSSNTDLVCRSPRIPAPGETITGRSFAMFAGGKGANQAVAAARAGAEVAFVGACGEDEFGIARRADLVAEGISVDRMRVVPGVSSGVALIVVDDRGENQIVYVPGANGQIDVEDAAAALADLDYQVVSMTFEIPFAIVAHAVRHRRDGALVVLNAAPYDDRLIDLLPDIDVLVCNEIEAAAVLGRAVVDATAVQDAVALRERGPKSVVLTLGGAGAVAADRSGAWRTPAPAVDVIDTTGAGDAFCGALSAWLADGRPLREAVRAGVAAGSLAVTREGAQPSSPMHDAISAMLQQISGG